MEENTGVQEEVATPSTEETSNETQQVAAPAITEDVNWGKAREVMRQLTQENQELKKEISSFRAAEMDSEDIVTAGQAKSIAQDVATEISRKNENNILKIEVLSKYPDFHSVVSNENINKLEKEHPAIADGIAKSSNPYQGAYDVIKAFYKENSESSAAAKSVEDNLSKPKSVHSQGYKGPLSEASKFENRPMTKEKRAEIWNLAQQYAASR